MKKSPDLTEKILHYIPEHARILDIGCGDGEFLLSLSGKGFEMMGVDPFIEKKKADALVSDILFLKGRAEALPVEDSWADVVLMQCVFSLCQATAALSEIKRVLKPEGLLIITDLMSGTETLEDAGDGFCGDSSYGLPSDGPRLGRILTREDMEKHFTESFELVAFIDEKKALLQMLIEAIFNDDCICVSADEQKKLKECKAGYGLWVWKLESRKDGNL